MRIEKHFDLIIIIFQSISVAIPKVNFPKKGDNGNTTKEKSMSVMHMDLNVTENTNLEVFFTCLGLVHLIVDFDCNYSDCHWKVYAISKVLHK